MGDTTVDIVIPDVRSLPTKAVHLSDLHLPVAFLPDSPFPLPSAARRLHLLKTILFRILGAIRLRLHLSLFL